MLMGKLRIDLVVFPVLVIAAVAAIIIYTIGGVSLSKSSEPTPTQTIYYPLGAPVIFNAVTDPSGTQYMTGEAMPQQVYTASNPVTVALAIGAGLRYQPADGRSPRTGYGHLHVIIDDDNLPIPGDIVPVDETHLDLADGSHTVTLPALEPGRHAISAVFTDSEHRVTLPYGIATIQLDVKP